MAASSIQPVPADRVGRTARIVVGALMTGLFTFGVLACSLAGNRQPIPGPTEYLGLAAGGLAIVMSLVVPAVVSAAQVRRIPGSLDNEFAASVAPIYLSKTILGNALLEGAGFLNLILYLVARQVSNLSMAAALLIVMAIRFPSQTQFESWVNQLRRDRP